MAGTRIDIEGSAVRRALLLAGSLGFVALCGGLLYARPSGGGRRIDPGSFVEFALIVGVVIFGVLSIVAAAKLFRSGTVVSIGPLGVFDRRISNDWIPWEAIQSLSEFSMNKQRWFVLVTNPARDASLPIRKWARLMVWLNGPFGVPGYPISANELKGGFPALAEAFRHGQQFPN